MRQIVLNKSQLEKIKSLLAEEHDTNGKFCVDIELESEEFDGLTVTAEGFVEFEGYHEDDRERGTGAFVETRRTASVELTGWAYDHITEDEVEIEIAPESVKVIDRYLNAA